MKGINTSAYINFDTAQNKALNLIQTQKNQKIGLYILTAIHTGLRTGDIQNLKWKDLLNQERLIVKEEKTGKERNIMINPVLSNSVKKLYCNESLNDYIFTSQKKTVFTTQALNRILKDVFKKESKNENISTHSLRKTFGRAIYDKHNQSEHALNKLSEMFSHSSIQVTRIYLGIKQEEFDEMYLSL